MIITNLSTVENNQMLTEKAVSRGAFASKNISDETLFRTELVSWSDVVSASRMNGLLGVKTFGQ